MSDTPTVPEGEPTSPLDPADTLANLAGQALENLVNQFARPLDFLRELVQNSIDAGSARVEVWLAFTPDADAAAQGVLEIHVDDWGEGMDERIIDSQLTRLFASSKEDDLTKIGKFGIGFTSIFAIRPEAVLLRTGRHGESWELCFHPDRCFDKVRLDAPVSGTHVTLFKRMPAAELPQFVRESRFILQFWCEHSNTPITFWDRTRGQAAPAPQAADPFAAFAGDSAGDSAGESATPVDGPEQINLPMALDCDLSVRLDEDGVQVVVGYAQRPRYGFYNGGLTLMSTENEEALGRYFHLLGHLSFKVKSNTLEHTLTRDNVLQDAHWEAAIAVLQRASARLQERLVSRAAEAAAQGEPLSLWHRYLARECSARALHRVVDGATRAAFLRDHVGTPLSLDQLEQVYQDHGAVLLHPGASPLADALQAQGVPLFDDDADLRDLLQATWRPPFFALSYGHRRVVRADEIYVLPRRLGPAELQRHEARLLASTQALLEASVAGRLDLQVAEFPMGSEESVVVEGPADAGVFRRTGRRWRWLPGVFQRRLLLLNRQHPYFLSQVVLAGERPEVAAVALAHAILDVEGVEGERTWRRLLDHEGERLRQGGRP